MPRFVAATIMLLFFGGWILIKDRSMFKVSWKVIILMLMERIIKGIKLTRVKIIACSIAVAGVALVLQIFNLGPPAWI